jgi:CDP-diglyceride synthetase
MKVRVITSLVLTVLVVASFFLSERGFQVGAAVLNLIILIEITLKAREKIRKVGIRTKEGTLTTILALFFAVYTSVSLSIALPKLRWSEQITFSFSPWFVSMGKWLLLSIVAVVLYDTLAFFIGRSFGRRKFADSRFALLRSSPKKSWEGTLGGFLGSVPWALYIGTQHLSQGVWFSLFLGVLLGLAAFFGDLFESAFKRYLGTKDMSNLLPGHGGCFDRVDSHVLSFIFVYLLQLNLGG